MILIAGAYRSGTDDDIFHPIAERLLEHRDGVLRVGGPSQGADLMATVAKAHGLQVYDRLAEIPGCVSLGEVEDQG